MQISHIGGVKLKKLKNFAGRHSCTRAVAAATNRRESPCEERGEVPPAPSFHAKMTVTDGVIAKVDG